MARFPSLTHLSLGDHTPCSSDSLLAHSKLHSLSINARWPQGAAHLVGHLHQLPALRGLTVLDSMLQRYVYPTLVALRWKRGITSVGEMALDPYQRAAAALFCKASKNPAM